MCGAHSSPSHIDSGEFSSEERGLTEKSSHAHLIHYLPIHKSYLLTLSSFDFIPVMKLAPHYFTIIEHSQYL